MSSWIAIFAQGDATQPQAPGWVTFLPFIVMGLMVVMYLRATSKQKRELQRALSALKKNDKVVTSGGILGVVVAIKEGEDEVTLKVDDSSNSRIRVLRSSVVKILSDEPTAGEGKP
jgi:preprotein translocase subunit YajC